jgi:hypothetical protein
VSLSLSMGLGCAVGEERTDPIHDEMQVHGFESPMEPSGHIADVAHRAHMPIAATSIW